MASLLLRAMLLGNLSVRLTAQVFLAPPVHVRFVSVDYNITLHWTPPSNASLLYYIQWKIYGETQWLDVEGCQGIQKPTCDVSGVTSGLREWYYARVHASNPTASNLTPSKSAWAVSPRFSPRWDTKISPPAVRLHVTEQGIEVRIKPRCLLVQKMQNRLFYKIYLTHTDGEEEVFEMDCCSKRVLTELNHMTKYCLQAQTLVRHQGKSSDRSPPRCATTRCPRTNINRSSGSEQELQHDTVNDSIEPFINNSSALIIHGYHEGYCGCR